MSDVLEYFKELLENYYIVKNAPDNGGKQSKINRIKIDIFNDFLNQDFLRETGVRPINSKVLIEFFMEADRNEEEYMKQFGFDPSDLAYEDGGLGSTCREKFIKNFKRYDLLDRDFEDIFKEYQSSLVATDAAGASPSSNLSFTSFVGSKTKKRKTKKRKTKKRKTKKRITKKRKTKKRKTKKRKTKNLKKFD